jgi:hypothetical protein
MQPQSHLGKGLQGNAIAGQRRDHRDHLRFLHKPPGVTRLSGQPVSPAIQLSRVAMATPELERWTLPL